MSDDAPILTQKFVMHGRLQGGSMYVYTILHDGKPIGSWSKSTVRRKGVRTTTIRYLLGTGDDAKEFETPSAFKRAYVQQLRDAEFDAAAPKKEDET